MCHHETGEIGGGDRKSEYRNEESEVGRRDPSTPFPETLAVQQRGNIRSRKQKVATRHNPREVQKEVGK